MFLCVVDDDKKIDFFRSLSVPSVDENYFDKIKIEMLMVVVVVLCFCCFKEEIICH